MPIMKPLLAPGEHSRGHEGLSDMADRMLLERLAAELDLPLPAIESTVTMLAGAGTPPFIARYRRERTGGLGEDQVRAIAGRLRDFYALQQRKARVRRELEAEGTLAPAVRAELDGCGGFAELEDLRLRHRAHRRTRGELAKERGLEPLARAILAQAPDAPPVEELAAPCLSAERGVPDVAAALEGAGHIIAEAIAEDPATRQALRRLFAETGRVRARAAEGRAERPSKYEAYYDFSEPAATIPSHRVLAIRRGEKEGWLTVSVDADRERALQLLRQAHGAGADAAAATVVETALADAYDRLIAPALEAEARADLKRRADAEAIRVFSLNLRSLLLQPPAGPLRTLGVNPGSRAGCRLAAVDEQGRLLEHTHIFPHPPEPKPDEARATARALIETHGIAAIAIGSGVASRETDHFFRDLLKGLPGRKILCATVNDAGANVYATSRAARDEFPDLDPAVRCAVTIARRLQDPLAELVQVDPKAIGVGQYQHDVNQQALREGLEAAVESCVNLVGVDLNRAQAALLAYVAGVGRAAARELVRWRQEHGPFRSRAQLREVPRFDPKRFEQAAPFLRIAGGEQPLDATGIHPERYELVSRIAADAATDVAALLGNAELIGQIDFSRYAGEEAGEPTLADIQRHLLYPGHDPRGAFRCAEVHEGVHALEDLKPGMILEGTVTNVTNFGAFVDVGLREDGLVHVSHLDRRYVKDPNEVARVGGIVRVKVLSVDLERRRIALSMKDALPPPRRKPRAAPARARKGKAGGPPAQGKPPREAKPKRSPFDKATPEDIARLIAHFQSR